MSFYSPIDRLAQTLPRPKGTGSEFMTELSKMPGYKSQEAEDRGLQALVNLPKMERAQFLAALKSKPPVVPKVISNDGTDDPRYLTREERMYGDNENQAFHEQYTLPGGKNYREILLQHPKGAFEGVEHHFGGTPNILASIRAKDRTGPNGEKIFHIEELQSDWHQQGREHGYRAEGEAKRLSGEPYKIAEDEYGIRWSDGSVDDDGHSEQYARRIAAQGKLTGKVPNAPFKKNWHEMALKKMIHHAAKNGYDSIAITPGAEQAERYGLSKHINNMMYDPEDSKTFQAFKPGGALAISERNATPERVTELVGKELAQKLLATPKQNGFHVLEGDDIKVGGEGMKGFYDKIVPNFLNQFGKKYGAKVGQGQVNIDNPNGHSQTEMLRASGIPEQNWGQLSYSQTQQMMAEYSAKQPPKMAPVHMFPITPEMRADVTKNGVPLYAKGGGVEVKPTSYDPNLQRRHPELEAAIRGVAAGTTTHKQLDKLIAKHKPIKPYEFVPKPATLEDAQRGLNKNQIKAWRAHEDWPEGTPIGGRLDINAYEHHGVWANSIHDESGEKRPTSYGPVISIKNVTFDPNPGKSEEVGTGEKRKSPFARIKGELHHMTEDEAVQHMVDNLHHPDYAQVGYDPRRHGHFYDRKTLQPVTHSPHVVQIGPLALAHKPTYGKRENYAKGGDVHAGGQAMGINVRSDKKANLQYADLIVDGKKTYESRNGDTLRPYVGKRMSIVRTGDGPAKAIGAVTVGEPMVVNRKKFREMEQHHLVPEGSAFDIASGTKHLYPMHDPERYDSERDVGHGIVARKVHMADGGPVPPLRPLNPQLAAAREQMAAQSALHKAYNEAMKSVYTNQMPTFAQWVASQGKAKGGRVLYHGTPYTDKVIKKFEVRGGGDFGPGIYMTTSPKSASDFSKGVQGDKYGAVYPLLASIKNPLRVKDKYEMNSVFDRLGTGKPIHETLQAQGYDGIHVTNPNEKDPDEQYYVAFHPKQVKSSITGKAKGGSIKPVGYTKERVTVSPNLDAMRYELESVKHYSKKVK